MMEDYCAFSQDHKCPKWEDYMLTRHELEQADRLCHGNWIENQRLYEYIDELRSILKENAKKSGRSSSLSSSMNIDITCFNYI